MNEFIEQLNKALEEDGRIQEEAIRKLTAYLRSLESRIEKLELNSIHRGINQ